MHAPRWRSPLLLSVIAPLACLVATASASAATPTTAPTQSTPSAASRSTPSALQRPAVTTQISRWATWAQRALGEARGANLTTKSQCLDTALSELHALGRIAQHQELQATSVGRHGSSAKSALRLTYQNAHASYRSARECGAVRITLSGSHVKVWIDPRVARFEPLHPDDRR